MVAMLTAKDIIEMEESIIHSPEPRKRSDTVHEVPQQMSSSQNSSDWNPALVSRRASVPMEIIIGGDGKPIFTASSNSTVGSPVPTERRAVAGKERSGSKKRNGGGGGSVKKKKAVMAMADGTGAGRDGEVEKSEKIGKRNGAKKKEKEEASLSPTDSLSNSMATCYIGTPIPAKSKNIENLPEREILRTELLVTVRDAMVQTD